MEIREALKEQFHAGLAMLAECIEKCPDDLWTAAAAKVDDGDRVIFRPFWRIAFHTLYFTHLYLGQGESSFQPWPDRKPGYFEEMWDSSWDIEPFEFPEEAEPISKTQLLSYHSYLRGLIDSTIDSLDLDTANSGFHWYQNISKLSHELLNLRHLQGHVGQLSELLMARGIPTEWVSRA